MSKQYFTAKNKATGKQHKTNTGRTSRFIKGSKRFEKFSLTYEMIPAVKPSTKYYLLDRNGFPIPSKNKRGYRIIKENSKGFKKASKVAEQFLDQVIEQKKLRDAEREPILALIERNKHNISFPVKIGYRGDRGEFEQVKRLDSVAYNMRELMILAKDGIDEINEDYDSYGELSITLEELEYAPGIAVAKHVMAKGYEPYMRYWGNKERKASIQWVGHAQMENCLLYAMRLLRGNKTVFEAYEKLPEIMNETVEKLGIKPEDLKVTDYNRRLSSSVMLSRDAILAVAKICKSKILFHTKLGVLLYSAYEIFNNVDKIKKINMVYHNGHCEMMPNQEITKVTIHKRAEKEREFMLPTTAHEIVKECRIEGTNSNMSYTAYYIDYECGEDGTLTHVTQHKYVNPFKIDLPCIQEHVRKEDAVPDHLALTCITDDQSLFNYCIRKTLNIEPTEVDVKNIIKKSVIFIKKGFTGATCEGTFYETDKNRCYMSYKNNRFYRGLPTANLYPMKYDETKWAWIAFVVPKKVDISKSKYIEAINFLLRNTNFECLTSVLYLWLIEHGCEIEIEYCLYTTSFQDIDIIKFFRDHKFDGAEKEITNRFVGCLIAGGMEERAIHKFRDLETETLCMMLNDCYRGSEEEISHTVTSYIPNNGIDRIISYVDAFDIRYKYTDIGTLDKSSSVRIIEDVSNVCDDDDEEYAEEVDGVKYKYTAFQDKFIKGLDKTSEQYGDYKEKQAYYINKLDDYQGSYGRLEGVKKALVSKNYNIHTGVRHKLIVDLSKQPINPDNPSEPAKNRESFTVTCNKKTGSFHTYSYILSYAAITMLDLWKKCIDDKNKVLGFNVDSLITTNKINGITYNTELNGWKFNPCELAKKRYNVAITSPQKVFEFNNKMPFTRPFMESERVLIHGPAGVSKSWEFYNQPLTDTVMVAPTKALRDCIRKNAAYKGELPTHNGWTYEVKPNVDSMTVQKYFGLMMNDDTWKKKQSNYRSKIPRYRYVVIDEFTQLTQEQWNIILSRCENSVLILLGDFCQLECGIMGTPVNYDYFMERGFTFREKPRKYNPNDKPAHSIYNRETQTYTHIPAVKSARHDFKYGRKLDRLRGLTDFDDLMNVVSTFEFDEVSSMKQLENSIKNNENCCIITYSHKKNKQYNDLARKNLKTILCATPKNDYEELDVTDKRIWWDRMTMTDTLPKGFKYEPRFSRTIYSLQGSESKDLTYYIDIKALIRVRGAIYTALTRAVNKDQIILINSHYNDFTGKPNYIDFEQRVRDKKNEKYDDRDYLLATSGLYSNAWLAKADYKEYKRRNKNYKQAINSKANIGCREFDENPIIYMIKHFHKTGNNKKLEEYGITDEDSLKATIEYFTKIQKDYNDKQNIKHIPTTPSWEFVEMDEEELNYNSESDNEETPKKYVNDDDEDSGDDMWYE